jgi:dGTPase
LSRTKIGYGPEDERRRYPGAHGDDNRSEFEHDRDRIVHSAAFRRLQGKTQVYGAGASDYPRSRLTHSLEVGQIGRSLALRLGADPDLTEAICLAHDIGHPPFGHAGEQVLHQLLRDFGGFNGNAQNLRILTVLEQKSQAYEGLNLTYATLDGLVKYPYPINPKLDKDDIRSKKGYYKRDEAIVREFKTHERKTFECELMNWADDVAYSSHDLEDAIAIGTIRHDDLESAAKIAKIITHAQRSYAGEHEKFADASPMQESEVHGWIGHVIENCIVPSINSEHRLGLIKKYVSTHIQSCVESTDAEDTGLTPARYSRRLKLQPEIIKKVEIFKAMVFICVIRTSPVYTLQRAGMKHLEDLFGALTNFKKDDNLLSLFPLDWRSAAEDALAAARGKTGKYDQYPLHELVRDYLALMTDANCESLWQRMFAQGGSLFVARA